MPFEPLPQQTKEVPFFEDAKSSDGWKGVAGTKSVDVIAQEVGIAVTKLGGILKRSIAGTNPELQKGSYKRPGWLIEFWYTQPGARDPMPGIIEVAGLPCRVQKNEKASLAMALFNIRDYLESMYVIQSLSPGFGGLVPFMLTENSQTISQRFMTPKQLSAPSDDVIEGQVNDA